ncbi:EVE domain-containing protein [Gammaproteobacteria bacterium AB-CW1]|uniref:EVE domain-containing protein n=1 Tax=Natronospira elongata TaxID=3110268 RepID=A0AAP6JG79_9GAMM|nr:EVE domain-containing protein [Gammaproteobacteria bacterium AB-CW1]
MQYWLMKSEPDEFSIDDLAGSPKKTAHWDGCRNYQVRNMMRDQMKKGDLALFYHSNTKPPGIAGIMEIVREGYPDHTAFDPEDPHFDPKSDPDNPRWFMVDVRFVEKFPHYIPLAELKKQPQLADMRILQRGNRLSITPVSKKEWDRIVKMGRE